MSDIAQPEPKTLTLLEANTRLPQVIQLLERLQRLQRALTDSERRREELTAKLAEGNGHSQVSLKDQLPAEIAQHDQLVAEAHAALLELEESGALLKDLEAGLVDFYGERAGEVILLCWRLGEEKRIQCWHTLEGGFAGRQPVDDVIK
jgi:hypothetical protein